MDRYLFINRNGILFGPESHVNVSSLVASSLDVADDVFKNGLGTALQNPGTDAAAFQGDGPFVIIDENGSPVLFAVGSNGRPGRFKIDSQGHPVLDSEGKLIPDSDGQLVFDTNGVPLSIVSVADGALIEATAGGRVMLLGGNVSNDGVIRTPDGQTIMAAGNHVYVQANNEMRGFLVEVDVDQVDDATLAAALADNTRLAAGNVDNGGVIEAARGNITLAGLAVNQQGRLTATTSVDANGIIRLVARDRLIRNSTTESLTADGQGVNRAGRVTFADGSKTQVLLDGYDENNELIDKDKLYAPGKDLTTPGHFKVDQSGNPVLDARGKLIPDDSGQLVEDPNGVPLLPMAIDEQAQLPSTISVMGKQIELLNGSEILAPAADVSLTALANPDISADNAVPHAEDGVGILIESGSHIDVSGASVDIAMERNIVDVELRGNELADSPLQRDGVLAGKKISIDVRKVDENGRIPIANVANAVAAIGRTVVERSTNGGSVAISSTGKTEFQQGAQINVSGGAVNFSDGYINTTHIVSDGVVYDISQADPNLHYDSILGQRNVLSTKWGQERSFHVFGGSSSRGYFEPGYVDGKEAGSVTFSAYDPTIDGTLMGARQIGRYQREAGNMPNGGELVIGNASGGPLGDNFLTPDVLIARQRILDARQNDVLISAGTLKLNTDFIDQGGFTRATIYSNGHIELAEDSALKIAPADLVAETTGSVHKTAGLTLRAAQIDINSDIEVNGGHIDLATVPVNSAADNANTDSQYLAIADDVALSTRGTWANDQISAIDYQAEEPDLNSPALFDGGSIKLALTNSGELSIGDRVQLDASAGAWLQADGTLRAGKGGSIELDTKPAVGRDYLIDLGQDLDLRAYALLQGGTLSLQLPSVIIDGSRQTLAGQRNDLNALTIGQRADLSQQVLAFWQAQQAGSTEPAGPQVQAVLDQVADTLTGDGSQTLNQQLALIDSGIDQARLAVTVPVALFAKGGFGAYKIGATTGDLNLVQGTEIRPTMNNLVLKSDFRHQVSGTDINTFSNSEHLIDELRRPTNLTLSVSTAPDASTALPELMIEKNAEVTAELGASVTLTSTGRIDVNGYISAPAGQINLSVDGSGELYNSGRNVNIAAGAGLNVAGTTVLQPNVDGLRIGDVLDGGNVTIEARGGGIDIASGATIDVSGTEATLDFIAVNTLHDTAQRVTTRAVASSAGSIDLTASEAIHVDGDMIAHADRNAGTAGGSLSLDLNRAIVSNNERLDNNYPQTVSALDWAIRLGQQREIDTVLSQGQAAISVDQLAGGFDALNLASSGQVLFTGSTDLQLGRSIVIDTPRLNLAAGSGASVLLDAPYIALGPSIGTAFASKSAINALSSTGGTGSLTIGGDNTHLIRPGRQECSSGGFGNGTEQPR